MRAIRQGQGLALHGCAMMHGTKGWGNGANVDGRLCNSCMIQLCAQMECSGMICVNSMQDTTQFVRAAWRECAKVQASMKGGHASGMQIKGSVLVWV